MENQRKRVKARIGMAKRGFLEAQRIIERKREHDNTENTTKLSVLKYGCESWTVNKNLMKRINAFEQWCYRRMLKKDKVPNAEVLKRVGEKEQQFSRKIVQQKLTYAGHALRGNSRRNALVILEGKLGAKEQKVDPGECGLMM